jgi:hypothetical protein
MLRELWERLRPPKLLTLVTTELAQVQSANAAWRLRLRYTGGQPKVREGLS